MDTTTPRLSEHVKVLGHDHILKPLIDRPMQRFTMDPRIASDGLTDGGDQPIPAYLIYQLIGIYAKRIT